MKLLLLFLVASFCSVGAKPRRDQECEDLVEGWFDAEGGPEFTCNVWGLYKWCTAQGDDFPKFGYTANEACCACGGGSTASPQVAQFSYCEREDPNPNDDWDGYFKACALIGPEGEPEREESDADLWAVQIADVGGTVIELFTGGGQSETQVWIYDSCRADADGEHVEVGMLYPTSTLPGFTTDSKVEAQPTLINFQFQDGIDQLTGIYQENDAGTEASLSFCVEVRLQTEDGETATFAEAALSYVVPLESEETGIASGADGGGGPGTGADGADNNADNGTILISVGFIEAYFCNGDTYEVDNNEDKVTTQGSVIAVCFKVVEGEQFEVNSIRDLRIMSWPFADRDNADRPNTQQIFENSVQSDETAYGQVECGRTPQGKVCVARFLLNGKFFTSENNELTGTGTVLLSLGAGHRRHRQLVVINRLSAEQYQIPAKQFIMEQSTSSSSDAAAAVSFMSNIMFGLLALVALVL